MVTEDMIADIVQHVHEDNDHAGWDATWKDVSSLYYSILRADVIFLLKQCQICASNTRKRPKNSAAAVPNFQLLDHNIDNILNIDNLIRYNCTRNVLEDENHSETIISED